jgi:hypothetical protein
MSLLVPLFADINPGLVKLIIVAAFLIIAGIGKLLQKMQGANQPGARPGPPAQPIGGQAADEIKEFLERAAKARDARHPRPVRPVEPRPVQPRPIQARPVQARPAAERPVQAELVGDEPVGAKIGRQVEKDLDTREFTQRTTQLGSEVAQADRQIDQHLHEVFDHYVSKLELVPGEAAAAPVAVGPAELAGAVQPDDSSLFLSGLTDLLTNPETLRQAIVLNEVIRRPEERWA